MRRQAFLTGLLAACLVLSSMPARAEMIATPQLLAASAEAAQREQVQAFLSRADVREQLIARGVDPAQASARVDALTTAELQDLAGRIDALPAGAGAIEIALLIILILIILELLGAIDIFPRI